MNRAYLEEDVRLIRKYFPGARAVALRTPFDLSKPPSPWQRRVESFQADEIAQEWYGDLLWNH
jgi:hypothetical protein